MATLSNHESDSAAKPKWVNVLLHGAYALMCDDDCIWAYTPACFGHMYNAGGRDYKANPKLRRLVDYKLRGVKEESKRNITPDPKENPVLSLSALRIGRGEIDTYDKRFTRICLPYPATRKSDPPPLMGALHAYVGQVYSGKLAAEPLNAMDMCPSMQILVYEIDQNSVFGLYPADSSEPITAVDSTSDPTVVNFHIYCTKAPDDSRMGSKSMTPEGHMRRTFAATVGLVGCLELVMTFPDGFHPAVPLDEALPKGVDPKSDLEPDGPRAPHVLWGKVNCGSAQFIFVP